MIPTTPIERAPSPPTSDPTACAPNCRIVIPVTARSMFDPATWESVIAGFRYAWSEKIIFGR